MAFPNTPIDALVEIFAKGIGWTDITADTYTRSIIEINRGKDDEGTDLDPSDCSLQLNNGISNITGQVGRYSTLNPLSDLYERIGRNTDFRVWVRGVTNYLFIPGGPGDRARVASSTDLDVTEDLDIRVELALDRLPNQPTTFLTQFNEIMGRYNATGTPGNRMWRINIDAQGRPSLTWSTDGDDFPQHSAHAAVPYFSGQRFAVRATLDVDNGNGGHTVTFYTATSLAGPWVQLGDAIVVAGTTSINQVGDASLEIGDINTINFTPGAGRYYGAELRDGIDGPLLASPDFTAQPEGDADFNDAQGNLWELQGDLTVTQYYRRFRGEVSVWPQHWDVSQKDVWVALEVNGPLRRYHQGSSPLQSVLRRFIPSHEQLLAYWPMEDGSDTISTASALPGGLPMATKLLTFGANSSLVSSDHLPTIATGAFARAFLPSLPEGSDEWRMEMVYFLDELPTGTPTTIMSVQTSGGGISGIVGKISDAAARIEILDEDGDVEFFAEFTESEALANASTGWSRISIIAKPDGLGTTEYRMSWTPIGVTTLWFVFRDGMNWTVPTRFNTEWGSAFDGMPIGHITLSNSEANSVYGDGTGAADDAFRGEFAIRRLRRIASETGVLLSTAGLEVETSEVGPQKIKTALQILSESAEVDGGILYEMRDALGLQYRPRHMRYNTPPRLELDYASDGEVAPPLVPVDDDLDVRNRVHVTREDGTTATEELAEGALSIQPPPDGIGPYESSVTLNLHIDEQARDHAGWLLRLGTVEGARYPQVNINLAAAPHLIDKALDLDIGDIITISNPPEWLPPEMIRLVVQGYKETFGNYDWDIEFNCTPAEPWIVGVLQDSELGRVDTDGSQLVAGVDSTEGELIVTTPQGELDVPVWIAAPGPGAEFTGVEATSAADSTTPDYLVATDADATGFNVGDIVVLYDSTGAPKEFRSFEVTGLPSAFGFTNIELKPDAEEITMTGDELRVATGRNAVLADEFPFDAKIGGERVTASGIESLEWDTFLRSETDTWGTSSSGFAWEEPGGNASDRSVSGGVGLITLPDSLTTIRFQVGSDVVLGDVDVVVRMSPQQVSTGGWMLPAIVLRATATDWYDARLHFSLTGQMFTSVSNSGAQVGDTESLPYTYGANDQFWIRARIIGQRILTRVWPEGITEPWEWHNDVTIVTDPIASGVVGVSCSASASNTNTDPAIEYDDFEITSVQRWSVTRSVNGIEKSHSAGAAIALARSAFVAL